MKRRDFLKKTTGLALAAGAAGALSPAELLANDVLNPAELLAADAAVKAYRLHMPEGQKVYLTHIASSLHPKDINAGLPEPLQTAEDGMEVVFREP